MAGLILVTLIIQTLLLVGSTNNTNRKITYFFDAVRNEDSTLHFSEKVQNKTERELNISLNKVNKLIQTARRNQISQEKYYSYILEKSVTGFMTYEKEGKVLLTNSAAQKLLGYSHLTQISQLARVNEKLYLAFKSLESGVDRMVKFNTEKEAVQLSLKPSSITIKGKELILVAINNIKSELEEQEIESWIRLIKVLTHEIMNSVTPITSLAETISEFYEDESNVKKSNLDPGIIENTVKGLNIIKQRGNGLITFVDSYRRLTKVPVPIKESFEVKQFLENIRILVSQEPNFKKARFTVSVSEEVDQVLADEAQLSQVLINLSKNALESLNDRSDGFVKLEAHIDNEQLQISVSDNGTGISPEVLEQIFIPFFTTKEQGTGIGLSLSHHILRLHGGSLQVNSIEGKGTTFVLTL
ncbi:MAG: PAS domain S-box protein [Reichenbachiella sp.]